MCLVELGMIALDLMNCLSCEKNRCKDAVIIDSGCRFRVVGCENGTDNIDGGVFFGNAFVGNAKSSTTNPT